MEAEGESKIYTCRAVLEQPPFWRGACATYPRTTIHD